MTMNVHQLVVLYIDFDQARRMNLPGGICLYCQDCHMYMPLGMAPTAYSVVLTHQAHQKACEGPDGLKEANDAR